MKTAAVMIVLGLVAVTALMVSLQRKLDRALSSDPQAPVSEMATEIAQEPVEEAMAAPAPPPRGALPKAAPAPVKPHYTQVQSKPAPAVAEYAEVYTEDTFSREIASLPEAMPQPALRLPPSDVALAPDVVHTAGPVSSKPAPQRITVPAGTVLTIRMVDRLDSRVNRRGDRFTAALDEPLYANGTVALPRGVTVEGRVLAAEEAGRVSGLAEMTVELDRLLLGSGERVEIVTNALTQQGETSRGEDAAKVGAGAAIGAAIGAIAGGRRGAGIGAAVGGGAAGGQVLLSRGKAVVLEPETRLSFQLRAPVEVEVRPAEASSAISDVAPARFAARGDADRMGGYQRPRQRRRW